RAGPRGGGAVPLPEITERVPLTLPDGRLDRRAVGWARRPLVDTDGVGRGLRGRGRTKRWEYWGVMTPTHVLALTVSSIDYAAVHEVWVLDRASGRTWGAAATVVPSRGAVLPGTPGDGPARARAKALALDLAGGVGRTRPRARPLALRRPLELGRRVGREPRARRRSPGRGEVDGRHGVDGERGPRRRAPPPPPRRARVGLRPRGPGPAVARHRRR